MTEPRPPLPAPVHTRALSVTIRAARSPMVRFEAYVLDLRKRGFVAVGGEVQGPGIIHHMTLEGELDARSLRLGRIEARMPTVAFEASAATGGESCRDRIDRVPGLAGASLDGSWPGRLRSEIGGVLGCTHVLTLAQLLAPTAAWALAEDARLAGASPRGRPEGDRIFRRDVVVDGADADGTLALTALLNDLHLADVTAESDPRSRLARQREIRADLEVALAGMHVETARVSERVRSPSQPAAARWRERPDHADRLRGLTLRSGVAREIVSRFEGDDGPARDLGLMLAPATLQCVASFLEPGSDAAARAIAESGGTPDSCYIWRSGGALRSRSRGAPPAPREKRS